MLYNDANHHHGQAGRSIGSGEIEAEKWLLIKVSLVNATSPFYTTIFVDLKSELGDFAFCLTPRTAVQILVLKALHLTCFYRRSSRLHVAAY